MQREFNKTASTHIFLESPKPKSTFEPLRPFASLQQRVEIKCGIWESQKLAVLGSDPAAGNFFVWVLGFLKRQINILCSGIFCSVSHALFAIKTEEKGGKTLLEKFFKTFWKIFPMGDQRSQNNG